ncbi:MAG: ATP-binding protein [Flavobacteriales bacterium]
MNVKNTKKYLFLVLIILYIPSCIAQKINYKEIDSVLTAVKKQNQEELSNSLYHLGTQLLLEDPQTCKKYLNYILNKDSTALIKLSMYEFLGKNLANLGETNEALEIRKKGLELSKKYKDTAKIIYYYSAISDIYVTKNKLDIALENANQAEKLAIKSNTSYLLSNIYLGKTRLYTNLNQIDIAFDYYKKIWELIKDEANTPKKRFLVYSIVNFVSQLDQPKEMVFFTEELSKLYKDKSVQLPKGHFPIKNIFNDLVNPKNISRYQKIVNVSDSLNSYTTLFHATVLLSKSLQENKQPKGAIKVINKTILKFKKNNNPSQLLDLYQLLTTNYLDTKQYKNAYFAKSMVDSLNYSIVNEKSQLRIKELEIEFETNQKEKEIIEKNSIIQKDKNQKLIFLFGIISLATLLILSSVFFINKMKLQKKLTIQKEAIKEQKIKELEQKNKVLAMQHMIEGQEDERLRIAKDLHDSLGGLLSTVKTHFEILQKEIKQIDELNITKKTNQLIDEACVEIRRISHNMMPHSLSISGLKRAIEDLSEHLQKKGIHTILEIKNLPEDIDNTKKTMMYRLLQEIISNVIKHSNAKTILIQLLGLQEGINIIIEDDGIGFNYNEAINNGGLGLKSINSRVEFLNGTISWDSQNNRGTSIIINIPN